MARCAAIEPSLLDAEIIGRRVGLRPTRRRIRLEHERLGRTHVVHNYGHGGSGVSLSWGCAREIATIIAAL
jgi:D-amino-acid oxidase